MHMKRTCYVSTPFLLLLSDPAARVSASEFAHQPDLGDDLLAILPSLAIDVSMNQLICAIHWVLQEKRSASRLQELFLSQGHS